MSDRPRNPAGWQTICLGKHAIIKARLGWKGLKAEEYTEDGYIFLATPNLKGV
jgi:type I restriction enzyme, S subunit